MSGAEEKEEEEKEEEEGSSFVFSGDGNINQEVINQSIGEDTLRGYQGRGWRAGHLHV